MFDDIRWAIGARLRGIWDIRWAINARLRAIWHWLNNHDIRWRVDDCCIVCDTCNLAIWCRMYDPWNRDWEAAVENKPCVKCGGDVLNGEDHKPGCPIPRSDGSEDRSY